MVTGPKIVKTATKKMLQTQICLAIRRAPTIILRDECNCTFHRPQNVQNPRAGTTMLLSRKCHLTIALMACGSKVCGTRTYYDNHVMITNSRVLSRAFDRLTRKVYYGKNPEGNEHVKSSLRRYLAVYIARRQHYVGQSFEPHPEIYSSIASWNVLPS